MADVNHQSVNDDAVVEFPNALFNPALANWNWADVIVIPSDDEEADDNQGIPFPFEDANVELAPHHNPLFNPNLPNWNWDDVIVIPSDDDDPDANVEIAPHHDPFYNPTLDNWNWDEVIVIPSDDDEVDVNDNISAAPNNLNVVSRKRVYALIDESDSDDEPYWSNAFLF